MIIFLFSGLVPYIYIGANLSILHVRGRIAAVAAKNSAA